MILTPQTPPQCGGGQDFLPAGPSRRRLAEADRQAPWPGLQKDCGAKPWGPTVFSAALVYLSFPNVFSLRGFPFLAWISIVPLMQALDGKSLRWRLLLGFLWGLLAHGLITNWFIDYSAAGFLFFIFLLSVQSVVFAGLFFPSRNQGFGRGLYVAAAWVASECLRRLVMRGFSWDLGHSQVFQIYFLQFADVAGSSGLSFFIILINYGLYALLIKRTGRKFWLGLIPGIFLFLTMYGFWALHWQREQRKPAAFFDACLVQPNVDFREKRQLENIPAILKKNLRLTEQCFASGNPDVILWPETAVPADFREGDEVLERLRAFVREKKTPLILGTVIEQGERMYNSLVFLSPQGTGAVVYRKRYLVPFSEYMPLGGIGAWLAKRTHIQNYDFSAGTDLGIEPFLRAGLMICSEDTLAGLFRAYRLAGARLIMVFLNDGWFRQPAGLAVHAQHAMMHAVENRISVIRVSNNGWSGYIDPWGRMHSGDLNFYQEGVTRIQVFREQGKSLYPVFSQIFCLFCWGFVIITAVGEHRFRKER